MPSKRFWNWLGVVAVALVILGIVVATILSASVMEAFNDYYFPSKVVMRVTSPDGKLDAVLMEKSGDIYWVYLGPKGSSRPEHRDKVFFADEVHGGIRVVWLDDQSAHIEFEYGDVRKFDSVWRRPPHVIRLSYNEIGRLDPGYRSAPPTP